ncbi:restriction endonuclease subunit S [Nitrosomonas sp. Is24]|uniref:restriction endonuclease subunit S n=1 Tax=Nitrosomonas sp. Is24 TaxID=3080533 RepID=UPI00294ADD86|nr:restriction endonuclease subunit S [Nitrosomonas sp. Is24]MDV6341115.1 restriction endonuclease subunit S [Nitrosomonas sp. Is24]
MSFPRYERYKDSGVEWLGEVPEHWEVIQSRRLFAQRKDRALESDLQLTASQKYGIIYQTDFMAIEDQKVVQVIHGADILKHVEPNDFVISMRSFQGGIEWSSFRGSISSAYVMLTPSKNINANFFRYLLKSQSYIQALQSTTNLVRDGQALRYDNFTQIALPVIPFDEQSAIATFLDRETAKIDALIAEQQRLIELLKEKRQAVISHAVTKGLNPDVPMKDSGVEWLGEVPEHWRITPFSYGVGFQEGPGILAIDFQEEGIPLLRISGIQERWATLEGCNFLNPEKVNLRWNHFRLKAGDLLISASASMGSICEVGQEAEGAIPYTGIIRLWKRDNITISCYVRTLVNSAMFTTQVDLFRAGATIQHFGPTHLNRMKIVLPPIEEQEFIATFLDRETTKLDTLTVEAQRAITLLQERRTALISAAVTGKIDVRNLVSD